MPHIFTEVHGGLEIEYRDVLRFGILRSRLVNEQVSNVTNTFTSWEKCMSQPYCKWPAIVALIVGGIIVLSIIICITRCLCFGYSFCCSCFACLNCCGCCGGCCNGRRRKSVKYRNHPSSDYRNQGYSAPPPMMKGGINQTQFAYFSTNKANSKPLNEDALPAMPSWDTATSVHVLDEVEDDKGMELKQISSSSGQNVPLVSAAAASGMSSPLIQGEYETAPFQTRPLPNNISGYGNPNDSMRVYENLQNQYPQRPYGESGMGGNNTRNGSSSSPIGENGYGLRMQIPYNDGGRSTPILNPYSQNQNGRSTPILNPYSQNQSGRSTPILNPYNQNQNGRSTPVLNSYNQNQNGRSTPTMNPYNESSRSIHPLDQNRFGSPMPGRITQGREYGLPSQAQRPEMNHQGYRY